MQRCLGRAQRLDGDVGSEIPWPWASSAQLIASISTTVAEESS